MKFKDYLKDKIIYVFLILFFIISIEILLIPFDNIIPIRMYVAIAPIILYLIPFFLEYYSKKKYYSFIIDNIQELDEKYLISEIINEPNFSEGKFLKTVLQDTGKSMTENVNKYKFMQQEYKEYIEMWIHEIKIPIAASKMVIENNKSKELESINEELDKIENYIEQALYYARSNTVEKDYYIRRTLLKDIVNASIIRNKEMLIQNKVNINLHDLEKEVYTDSKWCIFILNQIIQNAIKYSKKDNKKIEIYSTEKKEKVVLYIKDNGIGIKKGEITKVFEKGFTGENGRIKGKKSTGIGLYLCKKLCTKLGLNLELNSERNVGTEVRIIFPRNSFINF